MTTKNKIKLLPSLWAILETELTKIESAYGALTKNMIAKLEGDSKPVFDSAELGQSGLSPDVTITNNVAVLRIEGVIMQTSSIFTTIFGCATLDSLTADFNRLVANDDIDTIILYIGSPGGTVSGVMEFANLIFEAREKKTIISISSSIMTSAAMWIGAAAEHVLISCGTVVTGSIGILTTHVDVSQLEADLGIKTTEITAGREKRIASAFAPLTDAGRSSLQSQVDKIMEAFVGDIAKFRGVSEQEVKSNMADGKVFIGDNAVKAGLVDDIKTFDLLIDAIDDGIITTDNFFVGPKKHRKERNMHTAGIELGGVLDSLVDEKAEKDGKDRIDVIIEMANAAGISESTVNQIIQGAIICPPINRLESFAIVLKVPIETLTSAGNKDGCKYDVDSDENNANNNNFQGDKMGIFQKNSEANLDNLKAEHGKLYKDAVAVGVNQGINSTKAYFDKSVEDAKAEGFEAGVVAERARISGINECTIVGQEKLAESFIADGKTTPGEAAIKMINANKAANADGLKKIEMTSASAIADEVEETITDKKNMTAKKKWDADPKLAKEFDSFGAFEAAEKNTDNYRILKK